MAGLSLVLVGIALMAQLTAILLVGRHRAAARLALADSDARLDRAVKDMRAAHAELDSFAYTVAHDLRAPLRAIDGFSRALIEDFPDKLEPEAKRLLDIVRRNSVRMGVLMDDLLTFSRLSRQPLDRRKVDPGAIVRRLLNDGTAARQGREIAIAIGALPICDADPALLTRLYHELIDNAVKFTRTAAAARIEIASRVEAGRTIYFVADNGAGFDMDYAGKLFGTFQRLHRAEDYEGTGVGLAVAQRIVHRHGGEIWAIASRDAGATFSFTLERDAS
ncbi:MAG TPA: ATP-binding protein [Stellaceae bacterium]|nr:ATP-binding protein [Stellaceae bacterium]